jgi:hypothetical protein
MYASDMLALRTGQLRARGLPPRKTRGLVGRSDRNFLSSRFFGFPSMPLQALGRTRRQSDCISSSQQLVSSVGTSEPRCSVASSGSILTS